MDAPRLGDRVEEIVSGNVGAVTGLVEYLWGCQQALVHYKNHDGKDMSDWYDLGRLKVLERDAVVPIGYASYTGTTWVDGDRRVVTAAPVGADAAPPKR